MADLLDSIVYLANNDNGGSQVCMYRNVGNSQAGQVPDWRVELSKPGFVVWEGQPISADPNGRFSCNIERNAASLTGKVGTGRLDTLPDSDGKGHFINFNCFKDNDRVLFFGGEAGNVRSIYFCTTDGQLHDE
jgi:hypothetical protein